MAAFTVFGCGTIKGSCSAVRYVHTTASHLISFVTGVAANMPVDVGPLRRDAST
jgi:hypothetical protein